MMNWILAWLFVTASAIADSSVYFADKCSDRETHVSTPNGVKLFVNLTDLSPEYGVSLNVTIRPALSPQRVREKDVVSWKFRYGTRGENWLGRGLYHVDSSGNLRADINLPKAKWMRSVEARYNNFRIWDAEISWSQPETKISGTTTTSFYNAASDGPYFQVLSKGLCQREEKAEVTSKLYENNGPHAMTVTQQSDFIWEQGSSRGITLGYNNFQGNVHPLAQFSASSMFLGWLFRDWQIQSDTNVTSGIETKFTLNRHEAGVFITRMSFNRHKVRRFEWDPNIGECGEFVPVSTGYLEVGHKSRGSFVVVPADYYGRPEKLQPFIERASPPVNTCRFHSMGLVRSTPDEILNSAPEGLLLYYQL